MKFDIFGRRTLEVRRVAGQWQAFYCGDGGLKRRAGDVSIPPELNEAELQAYIADIFHEWASPERGEVRRLI